MRGLIHLKLIGIFMEASYKNPEELASYAIGRQIGEQVLSQPIPDMQAQALIDGLADVLESVQSPYPEAELLKAMNTMNERMQHQQKRKIKAQSAEGEAYLAKNAQRDEITVTESGLQYEVLAIGHGQTPTLDSHVKVHYHGTLINGTVFDSSVDRGEPIEFALNAVIRGWGEGLQLMQEGAKYRFHIPHELAYGAHGAGAVIGPYETLIFEVELITVSNK
jgi:FKBP-type peptidyl-prolyl cis-trans isomerase FklB